VSKTDLTCILQCRKGKYTLCKRNHTHNTFLHYLWVVEHGLLEKLHVSWCAISHINQHYVCRLSWRPCNTIQHRNNLLQCNMYRPKGWILMNDTKSIPMYILYLCDSWMTFRICILLKSICIVWHNVLEAVVFRTWEYSLLCELICTVCLMLQHIINKVLKSKVCIIYLFFFFMKQQHVCSVTTPTIQWSENAWFHVLLLAQYAYCYSNT
jgi:hypothetical protein